MLLKARIERLKAEFEGRKLEEIKCDGECNANILRDELNLYRSDIAKLQKTISKQQEQLKAQESVLNDAKNKYKVSKENYLSLKEEYDVKKSLVKKKVFYVYEIRNLKRELNKIESEMRSAKETIAQTKAKIQEIKNTIEETKLTFKNKAAQEHNDVLSELARLEENQKSLLDIISRTVIKSPIDGTVNELFIHTIGSSIPPGSEVLSIVPSSRELVAEVRVMPSDIGKIHIGQDAE
jgi:adhesin transport system membrane fusion protein